jgi:hypothetical protein
MPEVPLNSKLGVPPSLEEVKKATSQLSSGKPPDAGYVSNELQKSRLFVPQELKCATIVHLYIFFIRKMAHVLACYQHVIPLQ